MKYIDNDGDTWEDVDDRPDWVRCVTSSVAGFEGMARTRGDADFAYGPLRPLDGEEPQNDASDALPQVADVMDRAAVFQNAHALVTGLEWGEEKPSVYDVLNVAKWLEGGE